jgi:hypothetical protein
MMDTAAQYAGEQKAMLQEQRAGSRYAGATSWIDTSDARGEPDMTQMTM